jgi:hypothetical protein
MSAQRFGGAYSPGAEKPAPPSRGPAPGPKPRRGWRSVSIRAVGLGLAATPLFFAALGG